MFIRCDDEQYAIVEFGLTDAPRSTQLISVIGNIIALERWYRNDDKLPRRFMFQLRKFLCQVLSCLFRQDVGRIDNPSGQGRKTRRRCRGYDPAEKRKYDPEVFHHGGYGCVPGGAAAGDGDGAAVVAPGKLTTGADCAAALAANGVACL